MGATVIASLYVTLRFGLLAVDRRLVLLLLPVSDPAEPGFVGLVRMAEPHLYDVADTIDGHRLLDRTRREPVIPRDLVARHKRHRHLDRPRSYGASSVLCDGAFACQGVAR